MLVRRSWQRARWLSVALHESWGRKRVVGLSAEIAFFAVLGLFPQVIVFASILGFLDSVIGDDTSSSIRDWTVERVVGVFGADSPLRDITGDLFTRSGAASITLGILLSLYAASRGFRAIARSLTVVYDIEKQRGWLLSQLVGLLITGATLVVAVMVAAMVVIGPLLGTADDLMERFGAGRFIAFAWLWLRWPTVFLVVIAWMTSLYCFAPKHSVPWRAQLPGALVGTVWWLLVSSGFRGYLVFASSGVNAVLGVLGGALSLLMWLFLLSMGFLAGALLNSVLPEYRREFG